MIGNQAQAINPNFELQTAINIWSDQGQNFTKPATLGLSILQYLQIQYIDFNALFASLRIQETSILNGTVKYNLIRRPIPKKYDIDGKIWDNPQVFQNEAFLDAQQSVSFTVESLDTNRLKSDFGEGGFMNSTAETMSKSIAAFQWANALNIVINTAINDNLEDGVTTIPLFATKTGYNFKDFSGDTNDYLYKNLYQALLEKIYSKQNRVTTTQLGVGAEGFTLLCSGRAMGALKKLTTIPYADFAVKQLIEGIESIGYIAGVKIQFAPFLGSKYGKDTLSKDVEFDFENVDFILLHNEAVGIPLSPPIINSIPNPSNANLIISAKWNYSTKGVALRPSLVCIIRGFQPADLDLQGSNGITVNLTPLQQKLRIKDLEQKITKLLEKNAKNTEKKIIKEANKKPQDIQEKIRENIRNKA